jgi:DNA-binding transcriptional LysR family regulator
MDLNEIAVFLKVVQAGSFSQAARQLGMPNSTVSAKVSALEARLGVTLIQRTTRRLSVTDAGKAFFARCAQGMEEFKVAEEEVTRIQSEPQGLLRITAPVELGAVVLPVAIAAYTKKFPKVSLELILSDQSVDLVAEGVDLAIRAGALPSSSLIAKKLGAVYFAPFASRQYLKANGTPKVPKDLKDHGLLAFAGFAQEGWKLTSGKSTVTLSAPRKIVVNDLSGLKALAVSGLGIALLPTFLCHAEIRSEKLMRILPEWKTHLRPVHFVHPSGKFKSAKVKSFVETTEELIKMALESFEV